MLGKYHKEKNALEASSQLDLDNLCGPLIRSSWEGMKYFMIFVVSQEKCGHACSRRS